jgi:hypothetical protein
MRGNENQTALMNIDGDVGARPVGRLIRLQTTVAPTGLAPTRPAELQGAILGDLEGLG